MSSVLKKADKLNLYLSLDIIGIHPITENVQEILAKLSFIINFF